VQAKRERNPEPCTDGDRTFSPYALPGQPPQRRPIGHDAASSLKAGCRQPIPAASQPAFHRLHVARSSPAEAGETPVLRPGPRSTGPRSTGQRIEPSVQPSGPESVRLASSNPVPPGSPQGLRGRALSRQRMPRRSGALARWLRTLAAGSGDETAAACWRWLRWWRCRCGPHPVTPLTVPVSAC